MTEKPADFSYPVKNSVIARVLNWFSITKGDVVGPTADQALLIRLREIIGHFQYKASILKEAKGESYDINKGCQVTADIFDTVTNDLIEIVSTPSSIKIKESCSGDKPILLLEAFKREENWQININGVMCTDKSTDRIHECSYLVEKVYNSLTQ